MNVLITGATGMVGEGVMMICLQHKDVASLTSISRRPTGESHPKLREIIHEDFLNLRPIAEQLRGFDACYFCLGVSSFGMSRDQYFRTTHDLTMHFAAIFREQNPEAVFCYVSGAGTDSSEKGNGWAAVKGKVENNLINLFDKAYMFRPGFIQPFEGLKRVQNWYKYIGWLFKPGRALYPKGFAKLAEIGQAMIYVTQFGYSKKVLEGDDIIQLGNST